MSQREIKFRVWDSFHKKMSYSRPNRPIHVDTEYTIVVACGVENEGNYVPRSQDDVTIEQYTGLKDKNGVEVYEGDIVESFQGILGVVKWISESDNWDWSGWHYGNASCPYIVRGNVHQNPELLT